MKKALVGIIMGSDSDLPVMSEAAKLLEEFGVAYDIRVVSAHRTPDDLYDYPRTAEKLGVKAIIAGAGGSAHLPGMIAAMSPLPVIGVPVRSKNMDGLDSVLSIVQMPPGIPVATVAINGAKNAGLLAVSILATNDDNLLRKLRAYKKKLNAEVKLKSKKLNQIGYKKYLEN